MEDTKVALIGIEPSGEPVDITRQVRATSTTGNSRETSKHGGLLALSGQERGGGDVGEVAIRRENTMSTGTTGMHSTFGDLLWIVRFV